MYLVVEVSKKTKKLTKPNKPKKINQKTKLKNRLKNLKKNRFDLISVSKILNRLNRTKLNRFNKHLNPLKKETLNLNLTTPHPQVSVASSLPNAFQVTPLCITTLLL